MRNSGCDHNHIAFGQFWPVFIIHPVAGDSGDLRAYHNSDTLSRGWGIDSGMANATKSSYRDTCGNESPEAVT